MKNKFLLIGGMISAFLLLALYIPQNSNNAGSVAKTNEYKSINTMTITGSSTNATLVKTGVGALGSVIFSTTSAQSFTLYDVAVAANYGSTTLSTKILEFATGTPAGTYTFDSNVYKGLAVYAPITSTKDIVITYR